MIVRADRFGEPRFGAGDGIDGFEPEMIADDGHAGVGGLDEDVEVVGDVGEGQSAVDVEEDHAGSGGLVGVSVGVEIGGVDRSDRLKMEIKKTLDS